MPTITTKHGLLTWNGFTVIHAIGRTGIKVGSVSALRGFHGVIVGWRIGVLAVKDERRKKKEHVVLEQTLAI